MVRPRAQLRFRADIVGADKMTDNATNGQEHHGRAHWFRPEELNEEQRSLYDAITSGPRGSAPRTSPLTDEAGRLSGPFNAMLLSPRLGNALQRLGATVRYESTLGAAARELAILDVARVNRCDVEWLGHAHLASAAGISDQQLDAVRRGDAPQGLGTEEAAVHAVALALLGDADLDDARFDAAIAALGSEKVMETIILVGYYNLLGLSMRVWRTPVPPGTKAVFAV